MKMYAYSKGIENKNNGFKAVTSDIWMNDALISFLMEQSLTF
jgi:hypothetical protein